MKDWWLRWTNGQSVAENPTPFLLLALGALLLVLLAVGVAAIWRNRRLRERMRQMESRLDEAAERTEDALDASRTALNAALSDFKGDLVRAVGDLARLQQEQSGRMDERLRTQETGAQAQVDRLTQLDERLGRRLDASDRKLSRLCEQSALPARTDGAEYLSQGLRLVTEQLKVMSAQLEALEKAQNRLREAPPCAEELIVPAPEPAPDHFPAGEEPPRYENTSWD